MYGECTRSVHLQASATKADISPAAAEAGARAVSELSANRALKAVQQHVLAKGENPSFKTTIPKLAKALSKSEDKEGFEALLEAVEPHLLSICAAQDGESEYSLDEQHECMRCMNLMIRMQGKLDIDAAVGKVNRCALAPSCSGVNCSQWPRGLITACLWHVSHVFCSFFLSQLSRKNSSKVFQKRATSPSCRSRIHPASPCHRIRRLIQPFAPRSCNRT